jgi:hypothetical protein
VTEFSAWLDAAAARVFGLAALLFIALNAGAIWLVIAKRDRTIVNRWTGRWLAANLLLLGAGVGVPVVAKVVRMTVAAVAASRSIPRPLQQEADAPNVAPQPPR